MTGVRLPPGAGTFPFRHRAPAGSHPMGSGGSSPGVKAAVT